VISRLAALLAALTMLACGGGDSSAARSTASSYKPPVDPSLVTVRPILGNAPAPCSQSTPGQVQLPDPANPQSCLVLGPVVVDASQVSSARLIAKGSGPPAVSLDLTGSGQQAFQQFGSEHLGDRAAFVVNGRVVSTPTIQSPTAAGLEISGLTADEATELVRRLGGDTTTPTTSQADKDVERAQAICDRYAPTVGPNAQSLVTFATTAGEIATIAHQLGRTAAPWDSLPADHFVARCTFADGTLSTATTACPNGDTKTAVASKAILVDEDGNHSDDPTAIAAFC